MPKPREEEDDGEASDHGGESGDELHHLEGEAPLLMVLSDTGKMLAEKVGLDGDAVAALEDPGLAVESAERILRQSQKPQVKDQSRYATAAARRAKQEEEEEEEELQQQHQQHQGQEWPEAHAEQHEERGGHEGQEWPEAHDEKHEDQEWPDEQEEQDDDEWPRGWEE